MGKFDPALTLMEEAHGANKALGSPTSIYSLAITHNVIHILRGQYGQALVALYPSLEMDESQIVPGLWVDIFQQLAWCYYDLGAYDAEVDYCQRAIGHHAQTSQTGRSPAYTALAVVHIRRGNLAEAEAALKAGDKEAAHKTLTTALALSDKMGLIAKYGKCARYLDRWKQNEGMKQLQNN